MDDLKDTLQQFDAIDLKGAEERKLFRRVDSKFVFALHRLEPILQELTPVYDVLEVAGQRSQLYQTMYYDTSDFSMYLAHHNERGQRTKVRERHYSATGTSFFELKQKQHPFLTQKYRVAMGSDADKQAHGDLLNRHSDFKPEELHPGLQNSFERIALIHKTRPERLTFDRKLHYHLNGQQVELKHIVVAELKQERYSQQSEFIRLMKERHIRKTSFSKYCMGVALLKADMKKHRFRENIRFVNHLKQVI